MRRSTPRINLSFPGRYAFPYIDECMAVCVTSSCQDVTSRSVVVRAMNVSNACMGADDGGGRRPRAGVARHTTAR